MSRSGKIAIAVAAIALLWMVSGTFVAEEEPAKAGDPQPPKVSVVVSKAKQYQKKLLLRGVLQPARMATLRAEVDGTVQELRVTDGSSVEAGQPLLLLQTDDRVAQLEQAKAALEQSQIEYRAANELFKKQFASETRLAAAEAALKLAEAEVKLRTLNLARTRINAPFAGAVDEFHVDSGDYVGVGDPVATFIDARYLLFTGYLPQQAIDAFAVGDKATIKPAGSKQRLQGIIHSISATSNPQTRTYKIEIQVPAAVAPGVSAEATLYYPPAPAHFISPAYLALQDDGDVGVKTVDADNIVQFAPVSLYDSLNEGVWLQGLPAEISIITTGQGFVIEGDKVQPVLQEKRS